jgi:excisionase family DNA binding protein
MLSTDQDEDAKVDAAMALLEDSLSGGKSQAERAVEREAHAALCEDLIRGGGAAAKFLGLSRNQVYRMTENGHLPHVKRGGMIFYRKSELLAAFETSKSEAPMPKVSPSVLKESDTGTPLTLLVARLVDAFKIAPERFSSFYARMTNLRRLGCPRGAFAKRGVATYYTDAQASDLTLVTQLLMSGFGPEASIELARDSYVDFHAALTSGTPQLFRIQLPAGSELIINTQHLMPVASLLSGPDAMLRAQQQIGGVV